MGLCHHRLGRHAAAEILLKASLGLSDRHYPNYLLGTVYSAQKRYDAAAKALKHAIELRGEPEGTKVFDHEELGLCYQKLGRHAEARRVFLAGYQINPGRHRITYLLAESNDKLGRDEDAINYYQRYLDQNPANTEWKAQANRRLAALKPTPSVRQKSDKGTDALMNGIFKVIDAVSKSMEDFKRD